MKFLALLVSLSFSLPALASEPHHALTMHGTPKYAADFAYFDYVNPEAPKGGELKNSVVGTFDSLNPFIVKGTPASGINFLGQNLLYESLMEQSHDEPFSMYGLVAESAEMADDNSWIAFNLRPEARWHDGKAITADDVIWTFNTVMDKGSPFFQAYFGDVKEVLAESPHRVVFHFKHTENAELPLILSQMSVLPKHYWTSAGRKFEETSLIPPLGSSAYRITQVDAGRRVVYERVEDWWGKDLPINKGKYNFDKVSYEYFRDQNVEMEAFFSGNADVRMSDTATQWETGYDVPAVKDGRIIKELIDHGRPAGMQGFSYNLRRPVFQDLEVRKALAYAFDFEWSNKQFAYGSYKRTDSFFENSELASSGLPEGLELEILEGYRGRIPDAVFTEEYKPPVTDGSGENRSNLRTAIKLLKDAGYEMNAEGIRQHERTGIELKFEILLVSPAFERWVAPFVQSLKKIGVVANIRLVDPAQYQNRMNEFDYDMAVLSIGQSDSPGNEQRDFWSSEKATAQGSRNYMGVSDPVVDELIERIIAVKSREELVAATRALDRVLLHKYIVIPQWHYNKWRIAYWNHLARPEQLSPITPAITETWWDKQ